jgi:phosphotransferase system  glucose/maltose/N-acetylglucosamine-specific IIC component
MAQGRGLSRKFRPLLERTIFHGPILAFVAAGMLRRTQAVMPYAELAMGAGGRLLDHSRRRKTLAVATGVVGLALFLILLLEISLRIQLAQEARDAGTDATLAASASAPKELDDGFPVQPTGSALMQSSDQVGAPDSAPSSELTQTFGQSSREPIPLPRLRSR